MSGYQKKRGGDFEELRHRLAEGDPPTNMPHPISGKLEDCGVDLAQQRLYFSQNSKGDVEWIARADGTMTIRMTPFRAQIVAEKFSHVFEKIFGKEKWKIVTKDCENLGKFKQAA